MASKTQVVNIPRDDRGSTLYGLIHPAGRNWVGLIHDGGEHHDLDSWGPLSDILAGAGFSSLAADLPGHGLSDGNLSYDSGSDAVRAIVDFIRSAGSGRIMLIVAGSSFELLSETSGVGHADALVLVSPTGDAETARKIPPIPKLLIYGSADRAVAALMDDLFRASRGWIVQSSFGVAEQSHELLASRWSRQITQQIVAFLREYAAKS